MATRRETGTTGPESGPGAARDAEGRSYLGRLRHDLKQRLSDPETRVGAVIPLVLGSFVVAVAVYFLFLMLSVPTVENLAGAENSQATVVYSADGEQITRYYRENRTWVPLDSIAPVAVRALIDTEDRRFYDHWGIDVQRTISAVFKTLTGNRQGGSTITMQLVRNAYDDIGNDAALTRKFKEWLTALRIERAYEKDKILEIYFNTVSFNYNAFGIEAAARTYFGVPAIDLDTLQAATLVGMLKGTTLYNPVRNPELSMERRNVVLDQMVKGSNLTEAEYDNLRKQDLELQFSPMTAERNQAPFFAEHVRRWLDDWAEERGYDLYASGLRVYTTLDADLQRAADAAVRGVVGDLQAVVDVTWSARRVPYYATTASAYQGQSKNVEPFAYYWEGNPDALLAFIKQTQDYRALVKEGMDEDAALEKLQGDAAFVDSVKTAYTRLDGAFVAVDPENGYVKAWVGGRDFETSKYDKVAQSRRQPGSTFKPFVYAAALDEGYSPLDRMRDWKVEYVDPQTRKVWNPGNFGSESGRMMTLRDGLAHSKNTITAQLIIDVGAERVVELAKQLGITSDLQAVPSLGLGTSEVTLLEMVSAYAALASNGTYHKPLLVTRIEDRNGNVLETFEPEAREGIRPEVAYGVIDMMRGVVDEGTGVRIRSQYGVRGDLAGKTGTTQEAADGWFMLVRPDLAMGAWVGFPTPAVTFRTDYWGQGSHTALPIVGEFVRQAGLPDGGRFRQPPGYYVPPGRDRGGAERPLVAGDGRMKPRSPETMSTERARDEIAREDPRIHERKSDRDDELSRRERDARAEKDDASERVEEGETDKLNERERKKNNLDEVLEQLRKQKKEKKKKKNDDDDDGGNGNR